MTKPNVFEMILFSNYNVKQFDLRLVTHYKDSGKETVECVMHDKNNGNDYKYHDYATVTYEAKKKGVITIWGYREVETEE